MATDSYIQGRMKWTRPQGLLFSNDAGTLSNGSYVPIGTQEGTDFIILSDHNRSEINLSQQRIENRLRTINATMRSYHFADKLNISVAWNNLPSRSYSASVTYNSSGQPIYNSNVQDYTENGNPNPYSMVTTTTEYTADGGAGGVELLEWYEDHPGPFYVYLSYDKYTNFSSSPFNHLNQYNQILQVYFSSFDYSIVKRGSTTHDLWNISLSLEEV